MPSMVAQFWNRQPPPALCCTEFSLKVGTAIPLTSGANLDDWPVVVTNRCAERCAAAMGLGSQREARDWLTRQLPDGYVTQELPARMGRRRSPSGYFLVIDDVVVLPLAEDRQNRRQWIATDCIVAAREHGGARIDPYALTGRELVQHADITRHAVERFQQRCGAPQNLDLARTQLVRWLATTACAVPRSPSWCRTEQADFFVVADDELCLPARWGGGGGQPFSLTTCIHRSDDLFELGPAELMRKCRINRTRIAPHDPAVLSRAIAATGRLSWHHPRWVAHVQDARFWILLNEECVLQVSWDPGAARPLTVVGVAERRMLLAGLRRWLRGLFTTT